MLLILEDIFSRTCIEGCEERKLTKELVSIIYILTSTHALSSPQDLNETVTENQQCCYSSFYVFALSFQILDCN